MRTPTEQIVDEVTRKGSTRASIAEVYRGAIAQSQMGGAFVDWPTANRAILAKYAKSGLIDIKRKAWQG